jgi:hypothetical protein
VPFLGDLIGVLLSSFIVGEAARLGASRSVLARMAFNVAVEGRRIRCGVEGEPAQRPPARAVGRAPAPRRACQHRPGGDGDSGNSRVRSRHNLVDIFAATLARYLATWAQALLN